MQYIKISTIVFGLIILNLLLSIYLAYSYSQGSAEGLCLIKENGKPLACSDVQNSIYGSFLGIKVCHLGIAAFAILLIIFLFSELNKKHKKIFKVMLFVSALLGSLIAIYFLVIQFFILKTICSTCIIIDITTIVIFVLVYAECFYNRQHNFT